MQTLRKALPLLLLLAAVPALFHQQKTIQSVQAQSTPFDCSYSFTFTGNATQTGQDNRQTSHPCIAFRVTYSTSGTLTATVAFQTSPDNITFTAVPNTICTVAIQPPCLTDGANPTASGRTGTMAVRAYDAWTRIVTSGSAGVGTGTVVVYGYKGTSAGSSGVGSGGPGPPNGPAGGDLKGTYPNPLVAQAHDNVTTITVANSPYTVVSTDSLIICNAVGGPITILLPLATGSGREIDVKQTNANAGGNTCTITRAGADNIDGAAAVVMSAQFASVKIVDSSSGTWVRTHVNQLSGDVTGASTANTANVARVVNCPDTSVTPNVITCVTASGFPAAYIEGQFVLVEMNTTNTGATTINIAGRGAVPVTTQAIAALPANALLNGGVYLLSYDGTQFQLMTSSVVSGLSGLTTNTIPKATGASTLGDSTVTDDGTTVTATIPNFTLFPPGAGRTAGAFRMVGRDVTIGVLSGTGGDNSNFTVVNRTGAIMFQTTTGGASSTVSISAPAFIGTGLANVTGCSISSPVGGNTIGQFTSGTTGVCTVTLTFSITATNAYYCTLQDVTTFASFANIFHQTGGTTTTAVLTATTISGDIVKYACFAY